MLKFKLARVGKKKAPEYRILVVESAKDPYGKYVEKVGNYNPRTNPSTITVNKERVEYWLGQGVQPTATVHNIFVAEGLIKEGKQKAKAVRLTDKRREKIAEKAAAEQEAKAAAEEKAKEEAEEAKAAPAEEVAAEEEVEAPATE